MVRTLTKVKRNVRKSISASSEDSDQPSHLQNQNRHWAFLIVRDAKFLRADNEDSNQTARMRRLS